MQHDGHIKVQLKECCNKMQCDGHNKVQLDDAA